MNPGVTEEAAKVASTTVQALKETPMTLALVIFNVMFMLAMVYISVKNGARWDAEVERVHNLAIKLMTTCGTGYRLQSEESYPVELPPLPTPAPLPKE